MWPTARPGISTGLPTVVVETLYGAVPHRSLLHFFQQFIQNGSHKATLLKVLPTQLYFFDSWKVAYNGNKEIHILFIEIQTAEILLLKADKT